MAEELKPCPFCGHGAIITQNTNRHRNDGEFDVECDNCGAEIRKEDSPHSAAARWNTRAPAYPSGEGVREAVGRHLQTRFQRNGTGMPLAWERMGEVGREHWLAEADAILALLGEGFSGSSSLREDTHREAEPPVVGWQPIETHDGSREPVLLWFPDFAPEGVVAGFFRAAVGDCYYPGQWLDDLNSEPFEVGKGEVFPTHWMPLPAAPDATSTASQVGEG